MTVHDVRGLSLENAPSLALDLTHAVDGPAQRVDHTAKEPIADRHGQHLAGTANFLTFLNAYEIAENNHADLASVKVEGQAKGAILKGQQFVGHATRQSRHMRDAVTGGRHMAHFLGRRLRWRIGFDEIVERLAYRGGINGQFCHDHSLCLCIHSIGQPCRPATRNLLAHSGFHLALEVLQLCDNRVVGDLIADLDAHATHDGRIHHRMNMDRAPSLLLMSHCTDSR